MSCQNCPANQVPNAVGDGCLCKDGHYDASAGLLACYGVVGEDFDELDLARQDTVVSDTKCQPCDDTCFICASGSVTLNEGIALSESSKAQLVSASSLSAPAAAFKCPLEGCLGSGNSSSLSNCQEGFTGALCSVCADSFIRSSLSCTACSDTTGKSVAVVAVCVLATLVAIATSALLDKQPEVHSEANPENAQSGGMAGMKVLIGLLQVVTELPSTLNLQYPDQFASLLQATKILMLDIFDMFSIDCVAPLSLHAKFIVVMLLPWVGIAIAQVLAMVAACRKGDLSEEENAARQAEISSKRAYRSFFVIFMLCKHLFIRSRCSDACLCMSPPTLALTAAARIRRYCAQTRCFPARLSTCSAASRSRLEKAGTLMTTASTVTARATLAF